ncbi:MAG: septum formation initiator family protein, partial [Gammaproteobacteria bacterium]|nr:septum formation initiator family protein [Gammaproteobacteria bacterium]
MQWLRRYFLVIILALIFVLLQYELWFSRGGIFQNRHLQQQLATEKALVQQQQAENKRLLAEVMKIKNDPQQIEARARDDLGMVKKGEEYIEIAVQSNSNELPMQQNEGHLSDENIT